MIEELHVLRQIVGDLTGLGVWFVVLFFGYKLAWVGVGFGTLVATYKLCVKVFCCDVSKDDYDYMINNHKRELSAKVDEIIAMKEMVAKAEAETDRVLHMYQILKDGDKK